jgi:uncharacterized YccA/Bax inhibitor family protein
VFGVVLAAEQSEVTGDAIKQIEAAAGVAELGTAEGQVPVALVIVEIIRRVLTWVGIIFIAMVFYGGYLMASAGGVDEQIEKGRKIIIAAVVGIIIVLLSYSITMFIGSRVGSLVTEGGVLPK